MYLKESTHGSDNRSWQGRKGHDILIIAALIIMAAMVINFRWPLVIDAVYNTYKWHRHKMQ